MKKIFPAVAFAFLLASCSTQLPLTPSKPIEINLVALNDFHGNLEAGKFNLKGMADSAPRSYSGAGIANLSGLLGALRKEDPQLLFVGAGDLVGATPKISSMFADEATIEAMNLLGMRVTSLGNHEFDNGVAELKRKQNGGCDSPLKATACKLRPSFGGAKFSYLGVNVLDAATGKPVFPGFRVEEVKGVKIAFIGAVLKTIAEVVKPSAIAGLRFEDEPTAINAQVAELKKQGVTAFVVLIHEGGSTPEPFDKPDCSQLRGPIIDITRRLDPAVSLVISGHSHMGYTCRVDGRVVSQAGNYGQMLTRLTLTVDPASHTVKEVVARNVVNEAKGLPVDPAVQALLDEVSARSKAVLSQPVAKIAVPQIPRRANASGESEVGYLSADAQLAALKKYGAQMVFVNSGGIRADLNTAPGNIVTIGHTSTVLPFGNTLVVMNLSGAQLRGMLEGQRLAQGGILQVSEGISYSWDARRPEGQRILPETLKLNGKTIEDNAQYRIGVNDFLATGGDGLPVFTLGTERIETGIVDVDALQDYLAAQAAAGKPAGSVPLAGRVQRLR